MIEAMDDVARGVRVCHVLGKIVRNQRQRRLAICGRESQVNPSIERLRRHVDVIRVTRALVHLRQVVERVLETVRSRELAIQRIEAPVFLGENTDVTI